MLGIDGCELEVLKGMPRVLCAARLRAICVEVHFALLLERGLPNAPSQIERLLKDTGFHVSWADASHLIGLRLGS
jgi:hypothetical protein